MSRTPTRRFALLSFIVIGLITAVLCVVISSSLRRDMLEREWRTTSDIVATEARQSLTASDFAAPSTETARERFRTFYGQTLMMPEIIRVKIYDATMTVVWSDESRLIGQRFADNPQLQQAMRGRTVVSLATSDRKPENLYEPARPQLVEVYVPITFPEHAGVAGVAETYKQPSEVFRNIVRAQLTVVTTALGGAALLYLSLFGIVHGATRRIEQQHRALEQRSRELARANEELRAVQGQLLAAERMAAIGEVVAAVAHGIRNPLANIRAATQVALLDQRAAEASALGSRNMMVIIGEVDRLESRLRQLLEFVRPAKRQSQAVDLNTVIRGACEVMRGRLDEHDVVLDMRLAPTLPFVSGDAMLLEQVFVNLLSNAVEAMPPSGGTITVITGNSSEVDDSTCVFAEIQDTGEGIKEGEMERVFDLFHTTKAQGTGLGLALAKKFTEAHGGTITGRSHPDEGATFRVILPARARD